MCAKQLLYPFSESIHAESSSQRIMVDQVTHLLFLLFTGGVDSLHGNHDESSKKQRNKKDNQPILIQIIREVVLIQPSGGMIQNDGLTASVGQRGDSVV